MISEKMQDRLNQAINLEFQSAYLYLSMAAWSYGQGFDGFGHWMQLQYNEEIAHGMKLFAYINDQQGCVTLGAIEAPKREWSSALEMMEETLTHEKKVTAAYNELMAYAQETNDYATQALLQWYITEQVEEESTPAGVVDKLKILSKSPHGVLLMDREMAKRVGG